MVAGGGGGGGGWDVWGENLKVAQIVLKDILVQEILKSDEIFEVCERSQIR